MDIAKLAVYEHLNMMNECCHHKESGNVAPWVFSTHASKDFCYKQKHTRETQYSYEETYFEKKLCDSCKYLKGKLIDLNKKLEETLKV